MQLFASDKIALATLGVKEVTPAEEPELHGIIERLCVQADLPKPRVCVIETPMPNAFAIGRSQQDDDRVRDPRDPRACSTLPSSKGVMAHELTHVINRDVMVMTLASFFASLASLILQFAFFFGGGFGGDNERGARTSGRDPRLGRSSTRSPSCCCAPCRATASSPPTAARRCSPAARARSPRR